MKKLNKIILYIILITLACIFILPFLYALYTSFLPLKYIDQVVSFDKLTLDNYNELWNNYKIDIWYRNTIIVTFVTVMGHLLVNTLAGYALAKLSFPGRNVIFIIVLATMMIPFQLLLSPLYIMVAKFGWHNTLLGLTIPFFQNCLFVFMSRQFFITLPDELVEAARIDGLSRAGAFFRIIMPMSGAVLATIIIFSFTATWNAYIVPATFISTSDKYTLVVGLNTVKDLYFDRTNLTMAGVILLSVPILIIFLFLQKFFVKGIAATGIKG